MRNRQTKFIASVLGFRNMKMLLLY